MQQVAAWRLRFDFEKTSASCATVFFFVRGFAHGLHFEVNANGNARQWMVAVKHHMLRVNVGHRVQQVARSVRVAAIG